ncbi:hypothetical protein [Lysinibacillus sp. RC79]|uniref:hypothetical protein n=1 Tax=Lysinibacillus sp. RC79 TaxID=3156296 RepID=UPI0035187569
MFSGGTGTKDDPFLIKTTQDLISVQNKNIENPKYYYKQVADIDLSGAEWVPIGGGQGQPFYGTYDGGGYKINNLTITDDIMYPAFISIAVQATLINITIDNAYITNTKYNWIAILASQTQDCTITNCHVTGKMESTNENSSTGGLVSSAGKGTIISKCSANVDITAGLAGGLVCYSYAVIKDCYVIGRIGGVQDEYESDDKFLYAGTFAYYLYSGSVENCYTSVEMYDYSWRKKTLFLFADNTGAEIKSCYCDVTLGITTQNWSSESNYVKDIFIRGTDNNLYVNYNFQNSKDYDYWDPAWNSTGPPSWWPEPFYRAQPITGEVWSNFWKQVTSETHPKARTTTEMQTQSTFNGWDFDTVWTIDEGRDYPRFKLKITQIKCKRMSLTNYGR